MGNMAGTTQTGLGAGTVALSLNVFIVVMFYAQERFGICTAQQVLPDQLPSYLEQMRDQFCSGPRRSRCTDNSSTCGDSVKKLCEQICGDNCPDSCWNTRQETAPTCLPTQNRICGYSDATVCQYRNGRGTCVYHTRPARSSTFCICQNREISYTRCMRPDDNGPIIAASVFGSLFALLLLLVIIGAVILRLRRQERMPSFMKQTPEPANLPSVQLDTRKVTRALPPEPPVPGRSKEYSYAYDLRPAKPGVKEDPNQDDHTYYALGEGVYRGGNPSHDLDGQQKVPTTKELDTATENAKNHPCFVLNRDDRDEEVGHEEGGGHADGVDETDSSIGVQSKETNDDDYTPLVPTGNPKRRTEPSEDEVAASPTSPKVTSPIDSPTEGLSNGDAGTYFPLILSAEPKSHMEQSGYEVAKIPTSESHDATSPTGALSVTSDDNTYTPSVRTAEPKSPKEHAGYDASIIPNTGLAAECDVTSPYDHLDRKEVNETKEGALSKEVVDDYQHLVNN